MSLMLTFRLLKFCLHHCLFRLTKNLFSRHLSHYTRKEVHCRVNAEDGADGVKPKTRSSAAVKQTEKEEDEEKEQFEEHRKQHESTYCNARANVTP